MLALVLAAGSSLVWGLADFLGGLASRRLHALVVVLWVEGVGLVISAVAVAVVQPPTLSTSQLLAAVGAGFAGAFALWAFYTGLAKGKMSLVAPISAMGTAVPFTFGLVSGEQPAALALVGLVLAFGGVVLASRETAEESESERAKTRISILLALVAALGFGSFIIGIDHASEGNLLWPLLIARIASTSTVGFALLIARENPRLNRADIKSVLPIGVLDLTANLMLATATTLGLLSVVAVLGSLYPAVTVGLAWGVLKERIEPLQLVGAFAILIGVVLIAAG
mgnify:CR=1 FL=1